MKKIFSIIIINLFLSANAHAKTINLLCLAKSSKTNINGEIQNDDISNLQEQVLVINLSKKTLLDYGVVPGISKSEYKNINISNDTIEWEERSIKFEEYRYVLNRTSGQLVSTSIFKKESNIYKSLGVSYTQLVSTCKIKEKKF